MSKLITDADNEVFESVAKLGDELRKTSYKDAAFKSIDWFRDRMNIATGLYSYLSARFGRIKGARDSNWTDGYMQAKMDARTAGEKFVNASAERDADYAVKELSEVVLIFEGYLKAAEQILLSCKKNVDVETEEMKREIK